MKITDDVMLDLWPVYRSGEASEDTKALMTEYLASRPDFAASLERRDVGIPRPPAALPLAPDAARATLSRTKALLRRRTLFVALALVLMAIPPALGSLRMRFAEIGTTWFGRPPWRWENALSLASIAISAGFWVAYFALRRRLTVRGF